MGELKPDPEVNAKLKALNHPLRQLILCMVRDRGTEGISPRQLADQLREPLSNVSYHVRELHTAKALTLVGTRPVRGSMQHFYLADPTFTDSLFQDVVTNFFTGFQWAPPVMKAP